MKRLVFPPVENPAGLYDAILAANPALSGATTVTEELLDPDGSVRETVTLEQPNLAVSLHADEGAVVVVPDGADEKKIAAAVKGYEDAPPAPAPAVTVEERLADALEALPDNATGKATRDTIIAVLRGTK